MGGIKLGDLVLSIVERYLIQCPFLGVTVKRDSTVNVLFSMKSIAIITKFSLSVAIVTMMT